MTSLAGKVIAVTGGASGIGFATARLLASRGAIVSLADVQSKLLDEAAMSISTECMTTVVDVRDSGMVDAWIKKTVAEYGRLDGAVNCAGVFKKTGNGAPITEMTDEEWEFVLGINLTGMFKCLRAQLSHMSEGGSVVNISSTGGVSGLPHYGHYCSSKHGVIGLTRSVAKEMASKGIRVNCITPGVIDTPMLTSAAGKTSEVLTAEIKGHTPMARMGTSEELAKTVAFLLSTESSFTTGAVYAVDGGMTS